MIQAQEVAAALWIVDGQQRVTALAASLARPEPMPAAATAQAADPWVVYFDVVEQSFVAPKAHVPIPEAWVPLPRLLDAAELSEWVHDWPLGRDAGLRAVLFQAGRRIREYPVPAYVVETEDELLLRTIFFRINTHGKRLDWPEVHQALFGGSSAIPGSLAELARELASLGMGTPAQNELLQCVLACRGLDVTRNLKEHVARDPEVLRGGVAAALPALRRAMSFLRDDAWIPHLRLLPRSAALIILARFFALHPDPGARTRTLLRRFLWRNELSAGMPGAVNDRTLLRRGVDAAFPEDEEASVQALLGLLPGGVAAVLRPVEAAFDPRSQATRIVLSALASLRPRDLLTGGVVDVPRLLSSSGADAFPQIVIGRAARAHGCVNRVVHPPLTPSRSRVIERLRVLANAGDVVALRSHAVSERAAAALTRGDDDAFLAERSETIGAVVADFTGRLAEWGANDRPSIEYLLRDAERDA